MKRLAVYVLIFFGCFTSLRGQSTDEPQNWMAELESEWEEHIGSNELLFARSGYHCSIGPNESEIGEVEVWYSADSSRVLLIRKYGDQGGHCGYEERFYLRDHQLWMVHFTNSCWFFDSQHPAAEGEQPNVVETLSEGKLYISPDGHPYYYARNSDDLNLNADPPFIWSDQVPSFQVEEVMRWFRWVVSGKDCDTYFGTGK